MGVADPQVQELELLNESALESKKQLSTAEEKLVSSFSSIDKLTTCLLLGCHGHKKNTEISTLKSGIPHSNECSFHAFNSVLYYRLLIVV